MNEAYLCNFENLDFIAKATSLTKLVIYNDWTNKSLRIIPHLPNLIFVQLIYQNKDYQKIETYQGIDLEGLKERIILSEVIEIRAKF